ncbi:MAG: phosphoadenylyl-sulfate reductase [Alphaproteobacteria bacterium]
MSSAETLRPDTVIRDGHAESAAPFEAVPDIEQFLASNTLSTVRLPSDVDLEPLSLRLPRIQTILVNFTAFTDGRGFSIARELRKKYGYTGQLIAEGPLLPDQYVYALQCGFDAVKVDEGTYGRQSESHWFSALDAFGLTYQRGYAIMNGPSVSVFDARRTSIAAQNDSDPYFGLSAKQAMRRAIDQYEGKIVLASSLGVDSAVMLHLVSQIDKSLPIIFLDTGKHFRETLHYRDMLISDLGLTGFRNITPDAAAVKAEDPDGLLHKTEPDACCDLRKVRPLDGVISGYEARITGRKRYQTPDRANMSILETGGRQAKVNPLAYWSAKDVTAYMRRHDLPPHPMLALGFQSIGCQPCTTRVTDGEDPRAGRWRNTDKTECGIHYIDGKWVKDERKQTFEVF